MRTTVLHIIPKALLAAVLISSCLEQTLAEKEIEVSTDVGEVSAEAEFTYPSDSVRTIVVRANRSWYASIDESAADWVRCDVNDHINMTGVTDEQELTLYFKRNYKASSRSAVLKIWSGGEVASSVSLTQSAAVFRLNASADKSEIGSFPEEAVIHIDCNTAWTARIVEGTASVKLSSENGFDPSDLSVIFDYNLDLYNEKTAKIEIAAEGCEPVILDFCQQKALPTLKLDESNPAVVESGVNSILVELSTNIMDIVAEQTGGGLGIASFERVDMSHFRINFSNPADDPSKTESATVRFTPSGIDLPPVEYNFSQRGTLKWVFYDGTTLNIFGLGLTKPTAKIDPAKRIDALKTSTGAEYFLYVSGYVYGRNSKSSSGLVINTTGKILFPAIPGYILKSVAIEYFYHSSFKNTQDSIRETTGLNFSADKATASFDISTAWHTGFYAPAQFPSGSTVHRFVLGQISEGENDNDGKITEVLTPREDMAYALVHPAKNCLIRSISLAYEPANE